MSHRGLDAEIDRLYQRPLAEFTAARDALARKSGAPEIRKLVKPNPAAWGVNQLYWSARRAYDRLVKAADRLRAAHRALMRGATADVRAADAAYEEAVSEATQETLQLLERAGQAVSPAARQAVVDTLRALPTGGAPGRLTRPLRPAGLEALAGLGLGPGARAHLQLVPATPKTALPASKPSAESTRAQARARQAFDAARRRAQTARTQADRSERALKKERQALDTARAVERNAREALQKAEERVQAAERALERAERTARAAQAALADANQAMEQAELRATTPTRT